ncbi:spermidine synthase [Streptomyces sp. ODS28]|uniref:spermidine synthase n=1 Tax=Streptomyces sp. ODS28 TaxID=3136688 RepID=UPI0031F0A2BD
MIDRTPVRGPAAPDSARLPVPPALGRVCVLLSVFVCAACGLVYELELVALASYLVGDSVTQASVVLSVMVFAMGVGSLVAKRLRCRAASGFGAVEALLALVGGGSAMALYAGFAWFGEARVALVAFSFAIGLLVGAEMPLLMVLIQRIRQQDPGGAVADLFAADYVGALVGGLAFPFLLLPLCGQLTGALLTGVVNAAAGGVVVLWLFRREVSARARWGLVTANGVVLALLVAGMAWSGAFEEAARQAVYGGGVRVARHTDQQEVVLTGGARPDPYGRPAPYGKPDPHGKPGPYGSSDPHARRRDTQPLELFLDGRLRASSEDEARFHEALVHPAMRGGPHARVLVLGGGDGLAVREVLRYRGVREVTVVESDPGVAELARTDPGLRRLNRDAYRDPRVRLVTGDVFGRLRDRAFSPRSAPYDVVISDLPDPAISPSTKLYSQEFYGLVAWALGENGRLVVHAGAPSVRPRDYWTVESTVRAAGLDPVPYVVDGRVSGFSAGPDRSLDGRGSSGGSGRGPRDWGFVLASRGGGTRAALSSTASPPLRALSERKLSVARQRAERSRTAPPPPSSLMHPRYLR